MSSSYYPTNSSNPSPNSSISSSNLLKPSIYSQLPQSIEMKSVPDNPICSEFITSGIRAVDSETATMSKFEIALLSAIKTMLAEESPSYRKHLLKKELELGDDSLETPLGSNSQDELKEVFDSRISLTDGIESTGTNSQLISDAGRSKSGSENIKLVRAELIHSNMIEEKVDVNSKSSPLDSGEDSSSEAEISENHSTPSPVDEGEDSSSEEEISENHSTPSPVDEGNYKSELKSGFSTIDRTDVTYIQDYKHHEVNLVSLYSDLKLKIETQFLDYQEGKPFITWFDWTTDVYKTLNLVDNKLCSGRYISNCNFCKNTIVSQFGHTCLISKGIFNANVVYKLSLEIGYGLEMLIMNSKDLQCVASTNSNYGCMIFDRGKAFETIDGYSYYASDYTLCWELRTSCSFILMVCEMVLICASMKKCSYCVFIFAGRVIDRGKWVELSWNTSYCADSKLSYSLEVLSSYSDVLVSFGNGANNYGWQLLLKLSQEDCITSYACGRLLFDLYRMHQTDLWNSYLEVLVVASSKLFQKILNHMGSNNYELVLNANGYLGAAVVLVTTYQRDCEECDTLVADIANSMITEKLRCGILKLYDSLMSSFSSRGCLCCGRDIAGIVFDRGRWSELITRNGTSGDDHKLCEDMLQQVIVLWKLSIRRVAGHSVFGSAQDMGDRWVNENPWAVVSLHTLVTSRRHLPSASRVFLLLLRDERYLEAWSSAKEL